jgi:hypothetical protein
MLLSYSPSKFYLTDKNPGPKGTLLPSLSVFFNNVRFSAYIRTSRNIMKKFMLIAQKVIASTIKSSKSVLLVFLSWPIDLSLQLYGEIENLFLAYLSDVVQN